MNEREALKLALEALKQIDAAMPFPVAKLAIKKAEKALAQPHRKPLTDEDIEEMWQQYNPLHGIASFARAIEAAHGIK